jgi:hypothetical protein
MMTEIFAQGNLLLERVPDVAPSGRAAMVRGKRVTAMRYGRA